jgi:hypothetical protein
VSGSGGAAAPRLLLVLRENWAITAPDDLGRWCGSRSRRSRPGSTATLRRGAKPAMFPDDARDVAGLCRDLVRRVGATASTPV